MKAAPVLEALGAFWSQSPLTTKVQIAALEVSRSGASKIEARFAT
jgi:hypothetical protein